MAAALSHLLFLADYHVSLALLIVLGLILAVYSVPFLLLAQLTPRRGQTLKSLLIGALLAAVLAIDLYTSWRRFLPGYRPGPLESIIYLVVPVVESVPIGAALIISM